ncbi:MAG TPA: AgmX/PglI C-terminal domain-containing protein [Polyangiales bacterium]
MIASRAHEPKLRALEALQAQRLSAAGRARLRRHLERCELCETTLRGLRVHTQLTAAVRASAPQVDFARMELAMRQHARAAARRSRLTRFALPAAAVAVAAAVLLVLMLRPTQRTPQPLARPAAVQKVSPAQPEAASVVAMLTALRGTATVVGTDGSEQRLTLDRPVREGERIALAADAEVHVRLGTDTAMALGPAARVGLQRLREHETFIDLLEGSVTSQVRHLQPGERYVVHALGYAVSVVGTHFSVSVDDDQLHVAVEQGHVVVTDAQDRVVGDVIGPGSFEVATGTRAGIDAALVKPRVAGVPGTAWPALSLPQWPSVATWQVDGSSFAASGQLAMRVPAGDVTLTAQLTDGRLRKTLVRVPAEGLRVEEDVLRRLLRANDDEAREAGTLKPDAIMSVVQAGLPGLQRCYELSLKQRPDVSGRLTLRIAVDAAGRVTRVTPRGDAGGVPEDLVTCIRTGAERWRFPPPGASGITFDAPIRLSHQH